MEENVSLETAWKIIDSSVGPLSEEPVEVMLAGGRTLAEGVSAWIDLPGVDTSLVDGYAVRSHDLASAAGSPVRLKLLGKSSFITPFEDSLTPGGAVRVFSGSVIPDGADAVARDEIAALDGEEVEVRETVKAGRDIKARASELRMGEMMAPPGIVLNPGWLGLLIAAGWSEVKVNKLPRVRVIAVGDELKNPGRALEPGELFPSAATLVFSWCRKIGVVEVRLSLVGDDEYELQEELPAADQADLAITLGGTGHSERDVVLDSLAGLSADIKFRGVAVRPGGYASFAVLEGLPILCLPGGPSAADMMFQLLGRRIIKTLMGVPQWCHHGFEATLTDGIEARHGFERLVRVKIDRQGHSATPLFSQQVHRAMAETEGILRVPDGKVMNQGDKVEILELR